MQNLLKDALNQASNVLYAHNFKGGQFKVTKRLEVGDYWLERLSRVGGGCYTIQGGCLISERYPRGSAPQVAHFKTSREATEYWQLIKGRIERQALKNTLKVYSN